MTDTAYHIRDVFEPEAYDRPGVLAPDEWCTSESWSKAAPAYQIVSRFAEVRGSIDRLIADSHWIADLEDDWDGAGAEGFENETLDRAREWLLELADACWDDHGRSIPLPAISPADSGSIDLFWDGDSRLLINIPSGGGAPTFSIVQADGGELYGRLRGDLARFVKNWFFG